MKLLTAIKLILGEGVAFGDDVNPIKLMDKINEIAKIKVINYDNFELYKDKELGTEWMRLLLMRFYNFEILEDRPRIVEDFEEESSAIFIINFFISLFSKYEQIIPKYSFLLRIYDDVDFYNKLINNFTTTTTKNDGTTFLMPQTDKAEDTPSDKTKTETTQKTEYNTDYIARVTEIKEKYSNLMDELVDEFSGFFYYSFS